MYFGPLVTSGAFESDIDLAIDPAGNHHVGHRFNDADLVRLVNHLVGSRPLRTAALFLADIDQDLLVTGRDLEALVERVVGAGP